MIFSQTLPDIDVRPRAHLPSGCRIDGKYAVIRLLGEGGMGMVYLAEDTALRRHVAVKTIDPEAGESTRQRFFREARIAAKLQSDAIVRIHDFGVDESSGAPYFVMDAHLLSEGEIGHVCRDILGCPPPITGRESAPDGLSPLTLQDVLEGDRTLGEVVAARLGLEILDALAALHTASPPIIHRDLKPSNLLFTPSGRLLLADFGISKPERPASDSLPTLTLSGNPLGTPTYAAPEQRDGKEPTIAADYYAFGLVLYRMLTGGRPPAASTALPADVAVRDVPAWNGLLAGLLARDPASRLTDRDAIRRILVRIASGRRSAPVWIAVAAVSAMAAALFASSRFLTGNARSKDADYGLGQPAVTNVVLQSTNALAVAPSSTNAVAVSSASADATAVGQQPASPRQASGSMPASRSPIPSNNPAPVVAAVPVPPPQFDSDWGKAGAEALARLPSDMVPIPKRRFLICRYETTQALWQEIMGGNPSSRKEPALPVDHVSWDDCQAFIARLNGRPETIASGLVYRLPTWDEWAYCACGGGRCRRSGFCWTSPVGDKCYGRHADGTPATANTVERMEWYEVNSGKKPHPVGQREPNFFGLYDIRGNADEWTATKPENDHYAVIGECGSYWTPMRFSEHGTWPLASKGRPAVGFRLCADRRPKEGGDAFAVTAPSTNAVAVAPPAPPILSVVKRRVIPGVNSEWDLNIPLAEVPGTGLLMGRFEVDQKLWMDVMGTNPSSQKAESQKLLCSLLPVDNVSWDECQSFLEKLNNHYVFIDGDHVFRLPTEEEWMVACLAGAKGPYTRADDGTEITDETIEDFAHTWLNSRGISAREVRDEDFTMRKPPKTRAGGKRLERGNAFGLVNMPGNVAEWVADASNGVRIAKGGSCLADDDYRASARLVVPDSGTRIPGVGFRICAPKPDWDKAGRDAIDRLASEMVEVPGLECLVSKYEATQALWYGVMGTRPSVFKGTRRPIESVSWIDCQKFLKKLNALEAIAQSGLRYRLPTREEWQRAASGGGSGKLGRHADGTDVTLETLGRMDWYNANSSNITHAVGLKEPNFFGLYDLLGNVAEMTSHHYTDETIEYAYYCSYPNHPPANQVSGSDFILPVLNKSYQAGFRLVADRLTAKSDGESPK